MKICWLFFMKQNQTLLPFILQSYRHMLMWVSCRLKLSKFKLAHIKWLWAGSDLVDHCVPFSHRQLHLSYQLIFLGFKPLTGLALLVLLKIRSVSFFLPSWNLFWHSNSCHSRATWDPSLSSFWLTSAEAGKNQWRFCHYCGVAPGFL